MAEKKKRIRSIIALGIIVLVGLAGATFITIKLLNQPRPEEKAWNQARTLFAAGRHEEACEKLQICLGDPELDYHARELIVTARVSLKQFGEAQTVIEAGFTGDRQRQYDEGLAKLRESHGFRPQDSCVAVPGGRRRSDLRGWPRRPQQE